MNARSCSLRRGARGSLVGLVIAAGLILDPGASTRLNAQPPSQPKGEDRKAESSATRSPRASLHVQQLRTRRARAAYEIARLNHEIARLAVEEYTHGIYVQDLATVDGEVKLAKSDRDRAEDRLDWADRMFKKGYVSRATLVSEQLNAEKAKFALEQAQSKKKVLKDYTRDKTIKELKSEVKEARDDELAKKATWKREEAREADLERQVDDNS